jgi:hypothetical protein
MKFLKTLILLCAPSLLFAQISQNQLLLGGGFSGRYEENRTNNLKEREIKSYLNLGYFFQNKVAFGLRGFYGYSKEDGSVYAYYYGKISYFNEETYKGGGPFLRVYLLPRKYRFNMYTEIVYTYGYNKTNYYDNLYRMKRSSTVESHTGNFNLAPVFFINEHTSLELTMGYYFQKQNTADNAYYTTLLVGLGLQIHLGKNKPQ